MITGSVPPSDSAPSSEQRAWWSFSTAGRVNFGLGCSRFLPDAVRGLGNRVVVCTDKNLVAAGVVEAIAAGLRSSGSLEVLIYDGGEAEMDFEGAERCVREVRFFEPTVVVGLGGGSNLDLAKVVAARLAVDRPISTWADEGVPGSALPILALPTTAGTGSEVTSIAVLTDDEHHTKVGLAGGSFLPRVALVDPMLTVSCPPRVTAHSGMDALTHAIEAYFAIGFDEKPVRGYAAPGFVGKNPVSDVLALEAITRISRSLRRAVDVGDDLSAREQMALGSLLAGMAFCNAGTAIVHALQYPLGTLTKTAHGLGNAVLLPSAVRYNSQVRQREAAGVAWALGSSAESEYDAASQLPDLIGGLAASIGITPNLRSLGVAEADLDRLASDGARITRLTSNNPRPVDESVLREVLQGALDFAPRVVALRPGFA